MFCHIVILIAIIPKVVSIATKLTENINFIKIFQRLSAKQEKQKRFATIATNNLVNAGLCAFFMFVTCLILIQTIRICLKATKGEMDIPLAESPYEEASKYEGKVAAHG